MPTMSQTRLRTRRRNPGRMLGAVMVAAALGAGVGPPSARAMPAANNALADTVAADKMALSVTSVPPTATTAEPAKIVLGGGRLEKVYTAASVNIDDHYAVVLVSAAKRTFTIYVTSTLKCTGSNTSLRTFYELRDAAIRSDTFPATLATTGPGYTGSLVVSLHFTSADFTSLDARVVSGTLARKKPAVSCAAFPVPLSLRLVHGDAAIAATPRSPIAGGAYFGAVAAASQRTAFLLHVSADGKEVSNRQAELFLDCVAKKPYEFLQINDYAKFPIHGKGSFGYREKWATNGAKLGLDPNHRIEITTLTRGAFVGGSVVGVVRFDATVIDAASGKVLDTCTSKDQTFDASV